MRIKGDFTRLQEGVEEVSGSLESCIHQRVR